MHRKANNADMSDMTRRNAAGGLRHLRRPRLLTYVSVAALAAAVFVASGSAARGPSLAQPVGLQSFAKKLNERAPSALGGVPSYDRTPSFAWQPVRGATRYEFQLSTSDQFRAANGLVWSSRTLTTPATTIPLSLPWITGDPASLYWRVRAVSGGSVSSWSDAKPFTMRWSSLPEEWRPTSGSLEDTPGYVRWSTVNGATGYQVWFVNANKVITTITNVADEREYYAFHDTQAWTRTVKWRVRAVRAVYGMASDKLPAVSYGPWSAEYTWTNAYNPLTSATDVRPTAAVSNRVSVPGRAGDHNLVPGVLFAGSGPTNEGLHRVYGFSDSDCVNVVYRGAVVGGPAYAPRASGPLDLPQTPEDLAKARGKFLKDGKEDGTFTYDTAPVTTTETVAEGSGSTGGSAATASDGGKASSPGASSASKAPNLAKVDLWDRDWNKGGRYYFTVVPVQVVITEDGKVEYHETELPQDACQGTLAKNGTPTRAKRVVAFGKESVDAHPLPQAIGLSTTGRLLMGATSHTSFYGPPLVTWEAAPAAVAYDVEWSNKPYPWRAVGHIRTPATSALLPVTSGTWYYRVRGINESVPGNQKMTWSGNVRIQIAKPTFSVVGG
jgi:hypothetical protein